jgi:hypothetical protein
MRRKRNMIILLAVLIVLVGAYAFFSSRSGETPDTADREPDIEISSIEVDKIQKIILRNNDLDEDLVFEKEERQAETEEGEEPKTETVWVNKTSYPVKLVQSRVEDLVRTFSNLKAKLLVEEEPEDLSIYGLDKPLAEGVATLDDGTEVTLYLGNRTADGASWYLMKKGDPNVYAVTNTHGERLTSVLSDFRDKSLPSVDIQQLTYFRAAGEGRPEIEIVLSDDLESELAQYGINVFYMVKPYKRPRGVDTTKFLDERLNNMPAFQIEEFVDDHPEDYSKYGLDVPKLELTIKDYAGSVLDLVFGNTTEDGKIYFKTKDSDAVYAMSESKLSFLDFKPLEICDKFALLVNIQDIDAVTFEGRGKKHTLSIEREIIESDDEEEEDEVIETFFFDGKEVEEKAFKSFYQNLIGIVVDTEKQHTASGVPDLKLTFHTNKAGMPDSTVEFYPYDSNFYSLVNDGDMESEFLVSRNRLNWVFGALEDFVKQTKGGE